METILYKSNPWWEEEFSFRGYEREVYLNELHKVLENQDIIFITGLRRVGKSSLMKNFIAQLIQDLNVNPKEIFYILSRLTSMYWMSILSLKLLMSIVRFIN